MVLGMVRAAVRAAFVLLLSLAAGTAAMAAPGATGIWLTEGGEAQVEIVECGVSLCGRIIALNEPNDEQGRPKLDNRNPDAAQHGRPVIGLQILSGFVPATDGGWEGGTIYDPEGGKTYKSTLTLQGEDILRVRGYVGLPLFGRTEVWTRRKP